MKKLLALMTLAFSFALTSAAGASTFSGSLDTSDATWDGCGSATATGCNYDVVSFTVDTTGLYSFDAFYPGDTAIDENLDGFLYIFAGSFDPSMNGADNIAFDDDGPGGSNTSQILDVSLTAGTSYYMVVSSFSNAPTSFGQANGAWDVKVTGPGNVSAVPVPAAIWFMLSGLIGLFGLKRRS